MTRQDSRNRRGRVFITFGLGFGDEGKGATVDWLCRHFGAGLDVRYGGGPQAAHHVVRPDGRWHCFSQWGAGSLATGTGPGTVRTVLGPAMLIELECLKQEAIRLATCAFGKKPAGLKADDLDLWTRLDIDGDCRLVTPMNKLFNQALEITRGESPQGSCGQGVGDAFLDRQAGLTVSVSDVFNGQAREKLERLEQVKTEAAVRLLRDCPAPQQPELIRTLEYFTRRCRSSTLDRAYRRILAIPGLKSEPNLAVRIIGETLAAGATVVFEGSQGALLDRCRGFSPHVTKPPILASEAGRLLPKVGAKREFRSAGLNPALTPATEMTAADTTTASTKVTADPEVIRIGVLRPYMTRHGAGPMVTEEPRLAALLTDRFNTQNRWQGTMRYGWLDLPAIRYGLALNGGADWLALNCLDQLAQRPGFDQFLVCQSYVFDGDRVLLQDDFIWEPLSDGRSVIRDFRLEGPGRYPEFGRLTSVLRRCRPYGFRRFDTWPNGFDRRLSPLNLPPTLRLFLDYLQGPDGLNCPIGLIAFGPTAEHRLYLP